MRGERSRGLFLVSRLYLRVETLRLLARGLMGEKKKKRWLFVTGAPSVKLLAGVSGHPGGKIENLEVTWKKKQCLKTSKESVTLMHCPISKVCLSID